MIIEMISTKQQKIKEEIGYSTQSLAKVQENQYQPEHFPTPPNSELCSSKTNWNNNARWPKITNTKALTKDT